MIVPVPSCAASVFARSSHLLLTLSKLLPTRCEGVHLRVAVGVEAPPVGVAKMFPVRCEVLRDKGPLPAVEDVRSRRRVWYANGPADVNGRGLGRGRNESGRSVLMAGLKVARVF